MFSVWWPIVAQLLVWAFLAGALVMQMRTIVRSQSEIVVKADESIRLAARNRLRIVRLESKVFGYTPSLRNDDGDDDG